MRIGIDFDNTIVCYDGVFHKAALIRHLIPENLPASKGSVRDYLRSVGKEEEWIELQGYVYGARMDLASPFDGVGSFFHSCQEAGIDTCIISHKTLHPFRGPKYDLHQAAKSWLQSQTFHAATAYFELTLSAKLERIAQQKCTVFIDDLPELLAEPHFPKEVQKILFDPDRRLPDHPSYVRAATWQEIGEVLGLPCSR